MIDDPIRKLTKRAPTPAVIWVAPAPGEDASPDYDPDQDFSAAAAEQYPVIGAFSNVVDVSLDGEANAIFTIHKDDMPAGVRADFSRCQVSGVSYLVNKVRRRYWKGTLNGYTLALVL